MRSAYEKGFDVVTLTDCVAATSEAEHENAIKYDYPMFSRPMTSDGVHGHAEGRGGHRRLEPRLLREGTTEPLDPFAPSAVGFTQRLSPRRTAGGQESLRTSANGRRSLSWIWLGVAVVAFAILLQAWASIQEARRAREALRGIASIQAADERTREQIVALRIENETRADFWGDFANSLVPLAAPLAALAGGTFAFVRYLDTRNSERVDREALSLSGVLDNLGSERRQARAFGAGSLQHYLTEDQSAHRLTALSALVATARFEEDAEVIRSLRITAGRALGEMPSSVLRQVSWQGVKLPRIEVQGADLSQLDFRDAVLDDGTFVDCSFAGSQLQNAKLRGVDLTRAGLRGANLAYSDLAGATLKDAKLQTAVLNNLLVQDVDLEGADSRAQASIRRQWSGS